MVLFQDTILITSLLDVIIMYFLWREVTCESLMGVRGFDRIAWLENSLVQAPLYHPVTKDLSTEKGVVLLIDLNNVMDKVY